MKSLRVKIPLYFFLLMLFIGVIFSIGMNNFLDDYYYGRKIESMDRVVGSIDTIYELSQSEDEALMNIDYLSYNFDGEISIVDKSTNLVIYNNVRYQYNRGQIIEEITYHDHTAFVYETSFPVEGARWLIYIGELENDKLAIMQVSVFTLEEAISVIQSFFNILLLVAYAAAFFLALILARNISSPINQLHKVADSIGKLRFDVKYIGKREDEIGQLGNCLNQISHTLEETIGDLQVQLEKGKSVDRMRRRFVAQVSHELQTPISVISSYVEALNDGIVDDEEIADYYHVIEDESIKMSKIVKDLLQLSQLEAGAGKFTFERVELIPFLQNILHKYEQLALQQKVKFTNNLLEVIDSNHFTVKGDPLRLEQGFTNILSNAFKHSDDFVRVNLTQNDNTLILKIENSGEPIESSDLEHIFDSFYKGKTGKKKEGTGLGLSIAARIFDKHNIKYMAYNSEAGVVFELTIQLEDI